MRAPGWNWITAAGVVSVMLLAGRDADAQINFRPVGQSAARGSIVARARAGNWRRIAFSADMGYTIGNMRIWEDKRLGLAGG